MVNRQRKILKYIYKNPDITLSAILREFPDFEKYESASKDYLRTTNRYIDVKKKWEDKLYLEAENNGVPYEERQKYIDSHMPLDKVTSVPDENDYKFYSTNLNFQEYLEKRRHETILFWVPYGLTTIIAAVSVILQFLN